MTRPSCNFQSILENLKVEEIEEEGNEGEEDHHSDDVMRRNINQKSSGHKIHLRGDRCGI